MSTGFFEYVICIVKDKFGLFHGFGSDEATASKVN